MHALKYNYLFTKYSLHKHLPGLNQSADSVWCVDGHQGPQPCTATLAPSLLLCPQMPRPLEVRTSHISLIGVLRKSVGHQIRSLLQGVLSDRYEKCIE